MRKNKTVIVDLDGTIADNTHRFHFIDKTKNSKVDWVSYFLACDKDSAKKPVIDTVNALKLQGYDIHIFSARGDISRIKTESWLSEQGVLYDRLTMRKMDSYTPDELLKRSWLLELYPDYKEEILCVFDDRNKVVAMWRELGLLCFQVAEGDF